MRAHPDIHAAYAGKNSLGAYWFKYLHACYAKDVRPVLICDRTLFLNPKKTRTSSAVFA